MEQRICKELDYIKNYLTTEMGLNMELVKPFYQILEKAELFILNGEIDKVSLLLNSYIDALLHFNRINIGQYEQWKSMTVDMLERL